MSLVEFMAELSPDAKEELKALEAEYAALHERTLKFMARHPAPKHYEWGWSAANTLRPWFMGLEGPSE